MRSVLFVLALAAGCGSSTSHDTPDGGGADDDGGSDGPCTDGAQRCGPAMDVETCSANTWTSVEVCPLGCTAGSCSSTTTCSPGARACFGDSVGICNTSGSGWLYDSSCASTCASGACTGACIPGAKRCNAGGVETCAAGGASWDVTEACAHGCDSNQCVLDQLDVTTDTNLDGLVIVDGPVNVFAGATLHSPSGDLTIRATSITVDAGGAIDVAAVGHGDLGKGGAAASCFSHGTNSTSSGGGGGHATNGVQGRTIGYTCGGFGGSTFGSGIDLSAEPGGPGGPAFAQTATAAGGGVLRLYAPTITIAGTLRADGLGANGTDQSGGGGGAGGAILVAADHLTVTGTISAVGAGSGADYGYGSGGQGFIKLLYGAGPQLSGTITGTQSASIAPPLVLSSITHPDSTLYYNDDFSTLAVAWNAPFVARQGYYWHVDGSPIAPPTPAAGTLDSTETLAISRAQLADGDNYAHFVSIDAATQIGTVESSFHLRLNSDPPALSSQTHPSPTAWSPSHDPLIAWTLPHGDTSYRGVYYVLDHYGTTIPDATATFIPVTQHQLLRAGLASGIWALHVISVDQAGRRTRAASHYQVRIGDDPGAGRALGHVTGPSGAIANATVTFNRGLLADQHTNSGGTYDLASVPAGTWEVTASAPGFTSATKMVTVTASGQITTDFALVP